MEIFNRLVFVFLGIGMLAIGIVALGSDYQVAIFSFSAGLGAFVIVLVRVWHD